MIYSKNLKLVKISNLIVFLKKTQNSYNIRFLQTYKVFANLFYLQKKKMPNEIQKKSKRNFLENLRRPKAFIKRDLIFLILSNIRGYMAHSEINSCMQGSLNFSRYKMNFIFM